MHLCIQYTFHDSSPWGFPHSEIHGYIAYLQLPVAYRSLSRPSSAPDAKAFALCSSSLELSLMNLANSSYLVLELLEFLTKQISVILNLCEKVLPFTDSFSSTLVKLYLLPFLERPLLISKLIIVLYICSFLLFFCFIRFSMNIHLPNGSWIILKVSLPDW